MPPEIVSNKSYNAWSADVWSLGVVWYVLVCGSHPFGNKAMNKEELKKKIVSSKLSFRQGGGITKVPLHAKNLIKKMLKKKP